MKRKSARASTGHDTGVLQRVSLRQELGRDRFRLLNKQLKRRARQARKLQPLSPMAELAKTFGGEE